jgi:hypothetical protein
VSHGTCRFTHMYVNVVANSVMLYLQNDFCNIIFKIKDKLYITSGSAPPPPNEKFLVRTCVRQRYEDCERDGMSAGLYVT